MAVSEIHPDPKSGRDPARSSADSPSVGVQERSQPIRLAQHWQMAAAGLLEDRGTFEPGKRADLALVARDPRADIRATREIVWVMQGGRRVAAEVLLAQGPRGHPP